MNSVRNKYIYYTFYIKEEIVRQKDDTLKTMLTGIVVYNNSDPKLAEKGGFNVKRSPQWFTSRCETREAAEKEAKKICRKLSKQNINLT
jgi:hypothetical protein